ISQVALTNRIRNAKERIVTGDLAQHGGDLHLCIRDDGIGFEVRPVRQAALYGASLGLLSMEERAALAGGRFQLHSSPGEGTRVEAWFPLKWRADSLAE